MSLFIQLVHKNRIEFTCRSRARSFSSMPVDDSQARLRHRELTGTVASFRTWRGSRRSLAQDPAISGGQLNHRYNCGTSAIYGLMLPPIARVSQSVSPYQPVMQFQAAGLLIISS
jgi:hypothetical protein